MNGDLKNISNGEGKRGGGKEGDGPLSCTYNTYNQGEN